MKKVLFTATVDSHILHFHLPYLQLFKENGYEVHVATNGNEKIPYCDKKHIISFERSPYKINNLKAIKQLKKIINEEKFNIIHTHTPMGSVITRLAAKKARKSGTRVLYTAHGFHFYKGAPVLNWLLFYPVEKHLSKYTDTLITINDEDYQLAKNKFKKTNVEYVPGVGIDPKKFDIKITNEEKNNLRKELGLKENDFVMIYPAEISKRKRQIWLINTIKELLYKNKNIHLLLPGKDSLNGECHKLVKNLNLEKQIHLLGYRNDIQKLLRISNLAISSAKQEGLPVNLMEAMYVGIPIIASNCRGNRDLVKNGENGYLIELNDTLDFCDKIIKIQKNEFKYKQNDINEYILDTIMKDMKKIYFKQKKILHLLSSSIYSGAENIATSIIENLKEEYKFAYSSPKGLITEILKEKQIEYFNLEKSNPLKFRKIIKKYNPDIIHAHDFKASFLLTFANNSIKKISHIHKNDPKMKKRTLKSILYFFATKNFNKIIVVSNSIKDEFIFNSKIKNKFITLYNFIDKKKIIEKSNVIKIENKYDCCFFGRLSPEKNPLFFIELIKDLKKKIPQIKCIVIGDGILYDECLIKCKEYGLENNIEFIGFKKNPYPYVKNSKVCIMPSNWEGFGITAIEALILGVPVINSGNGGLNEIFDNSLKKYICKEKKDYLSKIEYYINNNKNINFDNDIKKYINKNEWIEKIKDIYN